MAIGAVLLLVRVLPVVVVSTCPSGTIICSACNRRWCRCSSASLPSWSLALSLSMRPLRSIVLSRCFFCWWRSAILRFLVCDRPSLCSWYFPRLAWPLKRVGRTILAWHTFRAFRRGRRALEVRYSSRSEVLLLLSLLVVVVVVVSPPSFLSSSFSRSPCFRFLESRARIRSCFLVPSKFSFSFSFDDEPELKLVTAFSTRTAVSTSSGETPLDSK
mmetsp:Transcript_15570/g.33643  ORF Transcript_15570/g.33643 Transcript_15570/m.33643 type:complete len:216 (+) Transcript_15570:1705-2352(+)